MAVSPANVETMGTDEFIKGLWKENPVFIAVLGLCPAMAVTNTLINGLVMGAATMSLPSGWSRESQISYHHSGSCSPLN